MHRSPGSDLDRSRKPEWIDRPERGNECVMRLGAWLALTLGRRVARWLLYPVSFYFLLFSPAARAASREYLSRIFARPPGFTDVFRHFHAFSTTILDRIFLLNNRYACFDVRVHGEEIVADMMARGEGCFLLGAHLGNFEIVRSLGRNAQGMAASLVMYEDNAKKLLATARAINPELSLQIIALGKVDTMLKVEAALARGEFVGMLGDRTIENEGTMSCPFLGAQARFPSGPHRIAMMLKRPIVLMFGLFRGGNRYDIYFERLADMQQEMDHVQRDLLLERSVRQYVGRIEHYCRIAPYNWFNFYDYWK